ncbi:hypothetical protein H5410_014031 [Solanum commersonii]|uniref:Uncharacterized protein n=1 Tax=Solanum commersonii TaxID=4109 RepID=A0A9J5ZQ90_SOLCO|nr:hypothetical protein H5410_014031 [Solanum commersonii]
MQRRQGIQEATLFTFEEQLEIEGDEGENETAQLCVASEEVTEDKEHGEIVTGDFETSQEIMGMENSGELWDVQEIEPLCTQQEGALTETERKATTWIHQNLLKLHKMFGVDFQGWKRKHLNSLSRWMQPGK